MNIQALLSNLRELGVRFSVQNGKLRSQSAKGALTPEIQAQVREHKDEIIAFLSGVLGAGEQRAPLARVDRNGLLPLSFAQQRLWFLDQLEPGTAFYNIAAAFRLHGQLDENALRRTFNEIVRRHEALRTRFALDGAEPAQVIAASLELDLPVTDVTHLPPDERLSEAQALARAEGLAPFDLAAGPLVRAMLIRLHADEHILAFTLHHIVSDGWSMSVMVREMTTLYQAYIEGRASPLPELDIQYADFAHWQRQWLSGEVLDTQLNYWRKRLSGAPALLTLPTDRPRPAVQSHAGATLGFTVPKQTAEALHALSKATQSTLFMTLAAAFNIVLGRYAGQTDICLGMAIANRNRSEIEPLIGFFINTLVLRTDLDGNPRFVDLLKQVRSATLEAYDHQDVPFEQLVEKLRPQRQNSYSPLFQVMLILQNASTDELTLPGLKLEAMHTGTATAKFDLRLEINERNGALACSIEYSTDLFDRTTMEGLGAHFTRLLEGVAADPEQPIASLPMQTAAEKRNLLEQWDVLQEGFTQKSDADLQHPLQADHVLDLIDAAVSRGAARTAVQYLDRQWSYSELDLLATDVARRLCLSGDRYNDMHNDMRGKNVAIVLDHPVLQIVAMLGALKAGAVFAALNPAHPQQRLQEMLDIIEPQAVITQASHAVILDKLLPQATQPGMLVLDDDGRMDGNDDDIDNIGTALQPQHAGADEPCYLYFTSGSTGKPKAVLGRVRGLAHFIQWEIGEFGLQHGARVSQLTTPTFDVYLRDVFAALCSGGTVCIPPPDTVLDPYALAAWLESAEVELVHCVPTLFRSLFDAGLDGARFPHLRHLLLAGEALLPADANRWIALFGQRIGLVNVYGPTETTLAKFFYRLPATPIAAGFVPVGRPMRGAQAIVLSEALEPCAQGEAGEIHIRTPYRSLGYYRRPELNQSAFIANPLTPGADDILYKTGDIGCILPDGNFRLLGRKDFQIKIRGMRIELGEIEAALAALPEVREAAVVAREDGSGEKHLCAYIVAAEAGVDAAAVRDALARALPDYMVPSHFMLLDALPLNANGKIDRKALPEPEAVQTDAAYVAPRNAIETILVNALSEVLRRDQVGISDDFFAIGGHSLLATQVISKLRAAFEIDLPLRLLFEASSAAALAPHIERLMQAEGKALALPPIVPSGTGDGSTEYPLSHGQQRIWFADQFERGSSLYSSPLILQLRGTLDAQAVKRSLNEIVRRHHILRAHFVARDGELIQQFAPEIALALDVQDLRAAGLNESACELEAQRRIREEVAQAFDLTTGPLVRARLFKLTEERHILLLNLHHIVSDGWSNGVIVRELAAHYEAYTGNRPSPLPVLPVQYGDYVHWQRKWLGGDLLKQQMQYWEYQLKGAPTLLELPTDFPRPPVQGHRGAVHAFAVPPAVSTAVRALAEQNQATPFMAIAAAFNLLLARYSGQNDICIGTAVANRNRAELEPLIGFFVNTLVLRTQVDQSESFTSLLAQVKETALQAFAHQDVPFEQLVETLKPERRLSHAPLFQVMLALQNISFDSALPGLSIERIPGESDTAKFDLTLNLVEGDGGFQASLGYNTDLFRADTVARMAGHLNGLLAAVVQRPHAKIADLSMLGDAERTTLLQEWNNTQADFPRERCIHQSFEQQAEHAPDAIAVECGALRLSYAQLNQQANRLAHHLRRLGVKRDTTVALCLERSADMALAMLAVAKAGGAYVPLDPAYPAERLAFMLADCAPAALLQHAATRAALQACSVALPVLDLDADLSLWADLPSSNPASQETADSGKLAYVIYTSGSTGLPKGVMVEHRSLVNLVTWHCRAFELNAGQRCPTTAGVAFDATTWEVWPPLTIGATLVVPTRADTHNPEQLVNWWAGETLDLSFLVTPLAEFAMGRKAAPAGLKRLLIGGDRLRQAPAGALGFDLINNYGPTESTVVATSGRIEAGAKVLHIGRPIANTSIYILDRFLQPVPVGVAGEIHIGGTGVARGYLNRPELTAQSFLPDPFVDAPDARMYKTGDLARYLADGKIEYLGRNDFQVKIRGFRIELGEIESRLAAQEGVQEAAVLARAGENGDLNLIAYVVATAQRTLDPVALRAALSADLADYMLPGAFVMLAAMPLTPNGKLDRNALPAPGDDAYLSRSGEAPLGETEETLAAIWSDILKRTAIGRHDNFFELGGHSLLATQVMSKITATFAIELPLRALFEGPTVAVLAHRIEQEQASPANLPPIVQVDRDGAMPLSFPQQRLWFMEQLESGTALYNISVALRIGGTLDRNALRRALNEVVRRHEALRTTFAGVDGNAVQVINPLLELEMPLTDLSGLPAAEREAKAAWLAQDEAQTPFDLTRGPLIRAALLCMAPQRHILFISQHHIVSDGWSISVMINEMSTLYQAYVEGQDSPLAEPALQYADFAHWQRRWLDGPRLERQIDYWKRQLDDAPVKLALPLDRPRPPFQGHQGARVHFTVGSETTAALRALNQRSGTTLFMALSAVFNIMLARYAGQNDICIGTPIANRNRAEVEGMIGFFVNTLVLRTRIDARASFLDLLEQVRSTALDAYANQDVPFEQLVDLLSPVRDTSHSPLFQVVLALQNNPDGRLELPGLTVEPLAIDKVTAKFDLTLALTESGEQLTAVFEYNTDLFDETTITRLATHFTTLLASATSDPTTRIADLAMLDGSETQRMLVDWNATQADYANLPLHQLFEAQVRQAPGNTALVFLGERLSFAELNARANRLAHYLRGCGVGPDRCVALCVERSIAMVVGMLGILKAGGAYVPLDPNYPHERLAHMLEDVQPAAVLTQRASLDTLAELFAQTGIVPFCLDDADEMLATQAAYDPPNLTQPDNLAYVIFTSGSSGRPKGVLTTHRAVANLAHAHIAGIVRPLLEQKLGAKIGARLGAKLGGKDSGKLHTSFNAPFVFDASVSELVLLLDGHALHIVPEEIRTAPGALLDFFVEHRLDVFDSSPAQLRFLLDEGRPGDLPPVVLFGGDAIDTALWQRLQALEGSEFFNAYGPTEATVDVALCRLKGAPERPVIGRAQCNTALYILDEHMNPVPQGGAGELYIAGHGLARGYLNRPEMTAEKFVPNPFAGLSKSDLSDLSNSATSSRMYRTGDLVRHLADGNIEYLGRIDDQVKVRGFRIELGEIATALQSHAAVKDAVVLAVKNENSTTLAAYVVRATSNFPPHSEENSTLSIQELTLPHEVFGASCLATVGNQPVALLSLAEMLCIEDAQQRAYQVVPLATMPYARADIDALHVGAWPAYFDGAPLLKTHWERMYRCFPQAQLLIKGTGEESGDTVGAGNAVLLSWDGTSSDLPKGWDGALARGVAEHDGGMAPNTLVLLAGLIDSRYKERKIAGLIVTAFKTLAHSLGLEHVIVALRPIAKTAQQEMAIGDYCALTGADGELADGWLRLHCKAGGSIIGWEEHSQYVEGSVAQWEAWSGQHFTIEGTQFLPDTLAPIHVDRKNDRVVYHDPCIWIEHPLPTEAAPRAVPGMVEIERLLREHTGSAPERLVVVADDAAHSWTDERVRNTLRALNRYAAKPTGTAELREHLGRSLPQYMIPSHFVFLDRLPVTASGKVDRKALPPFNSGEAAQNQRAAPENETERRLCAIWQDVLDLAEVGATDNFFAIGGDSILSIRVVSRAKQAGIVFTAKELFAHQTVRELAKCARSANPAPQHQQQRVEGDMPLLPVHLEFFAEGVDPHHFNQSMLLSVPEEFDDAALRAIVAALFERHDALRLRYVQHEGTWQARFADFDAAMPEQTIGREDLRGLDALDRRSAIAERGQRIQAGLSLEHGPLFRAVWFQGDPGAADSRLLLVLHHLIVDGVSWRILLKDLEQAYRQWHEQAPAIVLERKGSSFQQWGRFLHQYAAGNILRRELPYWSETAHSEIDPLPAGNAAADNSLAVTATAAIALGRDETQDLLSRCHQAYRTQINDLLLAGVMLGLAQWGGMRRVRIELEGHGREELSDDIDLNETVGWFTSVFPVLFDTSGAEDVGAAVRAVKESLRTVPQKGIGYGVLRYLADDASRAAVEPRAENAASSIVFNYLGQSGASNQDGTRRFSWAEEFAGHGISRRTARSHALGINGGIREGCLKLGLDYNSQRFSQDSMQQLAAAIAAGLRAVIAHCTAQATDISGDYAFRELVAGSAPLLPNQYWFFKRLDLNHWNASDLLEVTAPFGAAVLHAALTRVLEHHDGLRRVWRAHREGQERQWRQVFQLPSQMAPWWNEVDLSSAEDEQAAREIEALCAAAQGSLDIERCVFRAIYIDLGPQRNARLFLVAHHLLMDVYSGPVLLQDLEQACLSLQRGVEPQLPAKTSSMKTLAEALQERAQHPEVLADLAFWRAEAWQRYHPLPLEPHPELLLPKQGAGRPHLVFDALSVEETRELERMAERIPGAGIGEIVTTAVVQAYGKWSGSSALAMVVGQHGRSIDFDEGFDLSRSVGWSVNILPVAVDLNACITPLEAVLTTHARQQAMKGREAHYSLLRYMHDDPAVRAAMQALPEPQLEFQFVPSSVVQMRSGEARAFVLAPENPGSNDGSMHPGFRPWGKALVRDGRLWVDWSYCETRFSEPTMRAFLHDILDAVRGLVRALAAVDAVDTGSAVAGKGGVNVDTEKAALEK